MIDRKAKAAELHSNRYTCSQAVACAFCDVVDVDEETMKTIVRKYSGGAYKVCGAVMGAYVIANFIKGNRNMEEPAKWNEDDIELLQEIEKRFKEKFYCNVQGIKGIGTGIVLRPCRGCVEDAAEILEEILEERS